MKVHAWEINGFVKLSNNNANFLEKIIKRKYSSFSKFSNDCKVDRRTICRACQREGSGFIKISSLFKFTNFLKLRRNSIEKHIEFYKDSRVGAYGRTYRLDFPFMITPKVIRLVSHIVGDGSVYKDCIKYSQNDASYIKKLSEDVVKPLSELKIGIRYKNGLFKEQVFDIPMVVAKCVSKFLNISLKDFKNSIFIEKCLKLPKDFKVQVLAALTVDEGHVPKKKISMSDKGIVEKLCDIVDSLGYGRTNIRFERYPHKYKDKVYFPEMYSFILLGDGIRDFSKDLKKIVSRYGASLDLWNKQNELENAVKSHNYIFLEKHKKAKDLAIRIASLARNEKVIRRHTIIKQFNANPDSIDFILKTLVNKNKISRIDHGVYSYVK